MRYFHKSKSLFHCPTVNVEKLWSLVPADYAKSVPAGKAPVIDCVKAGIFKVSTRLTCRWMGHHRGAQKWDVSGVTGVVSGGGRGGGQRS